MNTRSKDTQNEYDHWEHWVPHLTITLEQSEQRNNQSKWSSNNQIYLVYDNFRKKFYAKSTSDQGNYISHVSSTQWFSMV